MPFFIRGWREKERKMFKTGIYKLQQLKQLRNLKTIFGKDKKISITLYREFADETHTNDITEKILLNFTDERGAFKRTYANRFEEFDHRVLEEIQKQFAPNDHLIIHDAAISDGRTACDFFEKLSVQFPKLTYYASDYDPHIFILQSGKTKVVINKGGKVLEIIFPPFVFNLARDSLYYPVNRLVRFLLEKTIVKRMILKYASGRLKAQDLLLFCPRAIKFENQDARFQLTQHNLLNPSPFLHPLNIFRAMNILNRGYFNVDQFKIIVDHVFNALSNNGLLITGSNQDSNTIVHGGIFQKVGDRFEKIWQCGEGSQIEDLILTYRFLQ
jgi:chemotaxis methyl-accepting protein methylase